MLTIENTTTEVPQAGFRKSRPECGFRRYEGPEDGWRKFRPECGWRKNRSPRAGWRVYK